MMGDERAASRRGILYICSLVAEEDRGLVKTCVYVVRYAYIDSKCVLKVMMRKERPGGDISNK